MLDENRMKGRFLRVIWALLSLSVDGMESELFGLHRVARQGWTLSLYIWHLMCLYAFGCGWV